MHVVVKEVAKARHGGRHGGLVVIAAEHRVEPGVALEDLAQAAQGVGMDLDVGIDEDDDLPRRPGNAGVAGGGRTGVARLRHDFDLVRLARAPERRETAIERRRGVRGRDDDAQHAGEPR